jgi:uncharacterized protein YbaR (Trm112 family)
LDPKLLEILACPNCHGSLRHDRVAQVLICDKESLAYPVVDGIPHLMVQEAHPLTEQTEPHVS